LIDLFYLLVGLFGYILIVCFACLFVCCLSAVIVAAVAVVVALLLCFFLKNVKVLCHFFFVVVVFCGFLISIYLANLVRHEYTNHPYQASPPSPIALVTKSALPWQHKQPRSRPGLPVRQPLPVDLIFWGC
jgi:cell division protein FtsW (lipid II flippase)